MAPPKALPPLLYCQKASPVKTPLPPVAVLLWNSQSSAVTWPPEFWMAPPAAEPAGPPPGIGESAPLARPFPSHRPTNVSLPVAATWNKVVVLPPSIFTLCPPASRVTSFTMAMGALNVIVPSVENFATPPAAAAKRRFASVGAICPKDGDRQADAKKSIVGSLIWFFF